jgi:hypothetical protein
MAPFFVKDFKAGPHESVVAGILPVHIFHDLAGIGRGGENGGAGKAKQHCADAGGRDWT